MEDNNRWSTILDQSSEDQVRKIDSHHTMGQTWYHVRAGDHSEGYYSLREARIALKRLSK